MLRDTVRAIQALLLLTLLLGGAYPVAVWGLGRAFADAADGSLIRRDGVVVGSARLGQPFAGDAYLAPRPSAVAWSTEGAASGGSNLGPNSGELADLVRERIAAVAAREGIAPADVPVELVTASASGVDPDISLAGALVQAPRIARARGVDRAAVERAIRAVAQGPTLGFLGSERVDVLRANLALDRLAGG